MSEDDTVTGEPGTQGPGSEAQGEKVRITSLDEAFDADMRATMAGARYPEPHSPSTLAPELIDYLRREYGLVQLEHAPASPPAGGLRAFFLRLARKLFVSRTYHASLVSALSELEARQRATQRRIAQVEDAQRGYDEVLARTLFKLWGDYNHVVRVVLEHHLNTVMRHQLDTVMPHVEQRLGDLAEALRGGERRTTASLEEVTAALRRLESRLGEIEGPHDRAVQSVAELIAGLGREESLARRVEALEQQLAHTSEGE